MNKRGRKSSAELVVGSPVSLQERPEPSLQLTPEQQDIWIRVCDALPADWFGPETYDVLIQYCRHVDAGNKIAQLLDAELSRNPLDLVEIEKLTKMQERESRTMVSLATKMRITQQSSYTDKSSSTAKAGSRNKSRPWE